VRFVRATGIARRVEGGPICRRIYTCNRRSNRRRTCDAPPQTIRRSGTVRAVLAVLIFNLGRMLRNLPNRFPELTAVWSRSAVPKIRHYKRPILLVEDEAEMPGEITRAGKQTPSRTLGFPTEDAEIAWQRGLRG